MSRNYIVQILLSIVNDINTVIKRKKSAFIPNKYFINIFITCFHKILYYFNIRFEKVYVLTSNASSFLTNTLNMYILIFDINKSIHNAIAQNATADKHPIKWMSLHNRVSCLMA